MNILFPSYTPLQQLPRIKRCYWLKYCDMKSKKEEQAYN